MDHGELDTQAPKDSPQLGSLVIAATVYKLPDTGSRKLGYIRLGGTVARDAEPVSGKGCKGKWYRVYPMGHVCTDEASIDMNAPLLRAASRRPDLSKPMPYKYGFVRATSPQYLRAPSRAEQGPKPASFTVQNDSSSRALIIAQGVPIGWVDEGRSLTVDGFTPGYYRIGALRPLGIMRMAPKLIRIPGRLVIGRGLDRDLPAAPAAGSPDAGPPAAAKGQASVPAPAAPSTPAP